MNKILRLYATSLCVSVVVLYSQSSAAQSVPSSADVVKASERYNPRTVLPESAESFSREDEGHGASPNESRFILGGVTLRGVKVYDDTSFLSLYENMIGQKITVVQANKIAANITKKYRADGYALAKAYIPTQTVNDNEKLIIQVNEGRIGSVQFQGEEPPAAIRQMIMRHIKKIRNQQPVKTDTLERYLLLINDMPGNTARALLRPSETDSEATDLIIYYLHDPLNASISTDNRGSRFLGPWQHNASLTTNGILGFNERISIRGVVSSPFEELGYMDGQYSQIINTNGTMVIGAVSHAKTRPGESLKALAVKGQSTNIQLRLIHPFLRSRLENIYGRMTFNLRNTTTKRNDLNNTKDKVRSIRLGASYDFADQHSATIFDAEISQGVDGLGSTSNGAGRTISNASHDYTKINFDFSHNHQLGHNFSLLASGSSQYAFGTLLSSEQFLIGGPIYGTAYDPGEISGDNGAAGKMELRYGQDIHDPLVSAYQIYSFYDIGRVWIRNRVGNQVNHRSLSSAGVGVRTKHGKNISSNVEVAIPLTRKLGADRDNDGRIFFGLSASY